MWYQASVTHCNDGRDPKIWLSHCWETVTSLATRFQHTESRVNKEPLIEASKQVSARHLSREIVPIYIYFMRALIYTNGSPHLQLMTALIFQREPSVINAAHHLYIGGIF